MMKRYLLLIISCGVASMMAAQSAYQTYLEQGYDSVRASILTQMYENKRNKPNEAKQKKIAKNIQKTYLAERNDMQEIVLESDNELITIAHNLQTVVKNKDYSSIWGCLQANDTVTDIRKRENAELLVMEHLYKVSDDISVEYIKLSDDSVSIYLFDHIFFEKSISGAWKACMLQILYNYLPKYWHANYNLKTYIYTADDLTDYIANIRYGKPELQVEQYDVRPRVYANNNRYYIELCYFNDWTGLVRSIYRVDINNEGEANIDLVSDVVLHEYRCGVLF